MELKAAWMVVLPVLIPVAKPRLVIVATARVVEVQDEAVVRSCVLPSLYFPTAVNCWVPPVTITVLVGVTTIDTNNGGVTFRLVEPATGPSLAWIMVLPAAMPVAIPALLIVATRVLAELQATAFVRF